MENKNKKGKTVLNAFIEVVNESNRKPNKFWVDHGRGFYNKIMKVRLDNNDILMYVTHNEGNSVIAERFIKALKDKICKKNKKKKKQKNQLMIANLISVI